MAKKPNISQFKTQRQNANAHTARGLGMLRDSIGRDGWIGGVTVAADGETFDGSARLETLADAMPDAEPIVVHTDGTRPVVVVRDDIASADDPRAKRLGLAANRVQQVDYAPDAEVLAQLAGEIDLSQFWNKDELAEIMKDAAGNDAADPGADTNRADELQEKWQTELGQLWQVGRHRLLVGDCTVRENVARLMGTDRAEMVWTDPPYGVAVGDKNKYLNAIAPSNRVEENLENDTLAEPELAAMLCAAFDNAIAVCLAGAAWYVAAPPGPLHVLFGQVLKDRGIWRQTIQWVKNNATFSPMGVDYHWQAEPIFYGWLPNAGHRYHGGRKQTTVWEIDRPTKSPEHPTMKPVELVTRALENSSCVGDVVLDLFLGSGTTLVACERLGRVGRGCELSPAYAAVTLERLAGLGLDAHKVE
jgi:DNA modification methylase